jgi:hypothetical protein
MTSYEPAAITDVIADGIERIELFSDYARVVYWHWRYHQGSWVRTTLDVAIVRPLTSFTGGEIESWCPNVVRVPAPGTGTGTGVGAVN